MTKKQAQARAMSATPKRTAAQAAIIERRAWESLQKIGYEVIVYPPWQCFIVRKAG